MKLCFRKYLTTYQNVHNNRSSVISTKEMAREVYEYISLGIEMEVLQIPFLYVDEIIHTNHS
jgi:hypothetical protein